MKEFLMYNICLLIDRRRTLLCNALLRYLRSAQVNILIQTTLSSLVYRVGLWLDSCSSENIETKLHGTREAKTSVTDAMMRPERKNTLF